MLYRGSFKCVCGLEVRTLLSPYRAILARCTCGNAFELSLAIDDQGEPLHVRGLQVEGLGIIEITGTLSITL